MSGVWQYTHEKEWCAQGLIVVKMSRMRLPVPCRNRDKRRGFKERLSARETDPKSSGVLRQNAPRFASKRAPICVKSAPRFASNREKAKTWAAKCFQLHSGTIADNHKNNLCVGIIIHVSSAFLLIEEQTKLWCLCKYLPTKKWHRARERSASSGK